MKINRFFSMMFFALILVASCSKGVPQKSSKADASKSTSQNVKVQKVAFSRFESKVRVTAQTESVEDLILSAVNGGKVEYTGVAVGDRVKLGQELARVNAEMVLAQLDAAQSQFDLAYSVYSRQKQLSLRKLISAQELEQAKTQLNAARAQLKIAKISKDQAIIVSPINGVVAAKFITKGEMVAPGTPVYNLLDLSRIKVIIGCSQADISRIRPGQYATVRIDSLNREFQGTVERVGQKADPKNGTFPVHVVFANAGSIVKSGMLANVEIVTGVASQAMVIRQDMILERDGKKVVIVVSPENRAIFKEVQIKDRNDQMVSVTGLTAGDTVVTEGQRDVVVNQKLTIQNGK